MRLLNTRTVTLETFIGKSVPGYAILSHTWAEEEILFEDMQTANGHLPTHKKGYAKVRDSCSQARRDGHKYIWIDTCCIDKSSSAELSEAINSMFNWYRSSSICYAYLIDVQEGDDNSFKQSRWFTRGWTLQELIAPTRVEFYDQTWCKLGERKSMASLLSKITGIDEGLLSGNYDPDCSHGKLYANGEIQKCLYCGAPDTVETSLASFSIAARMSWACHRHTARQEDIAYCLMGIFNVNMPLLYGEGEKAFQRLQEEIIRNSVDQSILASEHLHEWDAQSLIFADSPSSFSSGARIKLVPRPSDVEFTMSLTNQGLCTDLTLCPCSPTENYPDVQGEFWLGLLDCCLDGDYLSRPAIILTRESRINWTFRRFRDNLLIQINPFAQMGSNIEGQRREIKPFQVRFRPEDAIRRNVCLLSSRWNFSGFVTPPLHIKPIFQSSDMNYCLRASYPKARGNYIPPTEIDPLDMLKETRFTSRDDGLSGILCFGNESFDGFMVVWGQKPSRPGAQLLESESPRESELQLKMPWCKVLEWDSASLGEYDPQKANHIDSVDLFYNQFCSIALGDISSLSRSSMDIRHAASLVIARINSPQYLGRTICELEVEIYAIR